MVYIFNLLYLNDLCSSSVVKFRLHQDSKYWAYREGLSLTTAVMVRFLHWKESQPKAAGKKLGQMTLRCEPRQVKAALRLRKLFIKRKGKPNSTELHTYMHRLYNSLLQPKTQAPPDKLSSPAEVAISIAAMRSDNRWRTAAYVAQLSCRICFAYRCIWSHSARLIAEQKQTYSPYLPQPSSPSMPSSLPLDVTTGFEIFEGLGELDALEEDSGSSSGDEENVHIDNEPGLDNGEGTDINNDSKNADTSGTDNNSELEDSCSSGTSDDNAANDNKLPLKTSRFMPNGDRSSIVLSLLELTPPCGYR